MPIGPIHIIPPHTFSVVPRETLNRVAERAHVTQLSVAALNEPLRFGYGLNLVGGLILRPVVYGDDLLLPFITARGPISGVEGVTLGGVAVDPFDMHLHNGVASPPIEPWLQSAWAIQGYGYSDTLPNIAHGVIRITPLMERVTFDVAIKFRGLIVYDPRDGTQTYGNRSTYQYSNNPVLCLADFIDNPFYGKGETVDWSTVADCADIADQVVQGAKRRTIGLMIDRVAPLDDWESALRAYAGVWLVREGGIVRFVADAPSASVFAFTNAAGSANYLPDTLRARQRGRKDSPTVVTVTWTDTTAAPWAERQHTEYAPGVEAGTTPWRESVVAMPGIQNASQARREALRRLNEFLVADISATLVGVGNAVNLRRGDVVSLTDSSGFTAKLFRLADHRPGAQPGLWNEALVEYAEEVYSDAVVTTPGPIDTTLPIPTQPTAVTGLTLAEEVYQVQTGLFASRIRASWSPPAGFPFILGYAVELTEGGDVIESGFPLVGSVEWVSKPLQENRTYTVTVRVVSLTGATSAAASASITNSGKLAKPSPVPAFSGYEVGGEVRLEWTPATDLDMTAHEIRYSTTGGTWEGATLVDRIATPARRYTTKSIPPGTWRFWIKGLDSVRTPTYPFGQESIDATFVDIDVTSDQNAFVASAYQFIAPSLFNMVASSGGAYAPGDRLMTAIDGDTWDTTFSGLLTSYTGFPLFSWHSNAVSGYATEIYDVGISVTGDWFAAVDYTVLYSTAAVFMDLNNAGPEAAKTITGATNATPIVLQITGHGYATGDEIEVAGVGGNTAANGQRKVTVVDANNVSIQDLIGRNIAGNGAYTSGGTAKRWKWTTYPSLSAKTTARFVRVRLVAAQDATVVVTNPGSFRVVVVTRKDGGPITCVASGPTVFEFSQTFNRAVYAGADAIGSAGEYAQVDRIEVSQGRGIGTARFIRLNGTTQYVDMGDQAAHSRGAGDFAIEAWVRVSAIGAAQVIAGKSNDGIAGEYVLFVNAPSGRPQVNVMDTTGGGRKEFAANVVLTAEVWHHVGFIYTHSGTSGVFVIDGVVVPLTTGTVGSFTQMRDTANTFRVGAQGAGNYFGGGIDEVRLWSSRTPAEIAANKDVLLLSGTGLISRWGFDEVSGTSAADSVGGYTGTVNGTPAGSFLFRPYNGLDVYRFNASGAQVPGDAFVKFEGV